MLELFINTASTTTSFYCSKAGILLTQESFTDNNSQANTLLPAIQKSFKDCDLNLKDITKIICVTGPGSFTGVRIGVTIANIFAQQTKATLHEIDLFTLLERKNTSQEGTIIIKAGRNEVYTKPSNSPLMEFEIHPLNEELIKKCQPQIWGDLTDQQLIKFKSYIASSPDHSWLETNQLKSDFEAMKNFKSAPVPLIKPLYLKSPNITKPKCST